MEIVQVEIVQVGQTQMEAELKWVMCPIPGKSRWG